MERAAKRSAMSISRRDPAAWRHLPPDSPVSSSADSNSDSRKDALGKDCLELMDAGSSSLTTSGGSPDSTYLAAMILTKDVSDSSSPRAIAPVYGRYTAETSQRPHPMSSSALDRLTHRTKFAGRYVISHAKIEGKQYIKFARRRKLPVVLKFYEDKLAYLRARNNLQSLSADYVCRLIAVVEEPGFPPCLVLERGQYSLQDWIKATRLDPLTRRAALFQIAECIKYLHQQGIVHGNIKPSSVMFFTSCLSWKLINFEKAGPKQDRCWTSLNGLNPFYTAPEMIRQEEGSHPIPWDTSMDIWSLGILAFEIVTGHRFYGEATRDDVRDLLLSKGRLTALEDIKEDTIGGLIHGLVLRDPERRCSIDSVLRHAAFLPGDNAVTLYSSLQRLASGIENVRNDIREMSANIADIREVLLTAVDEIRTADLMINITIEESETASVGSGREVNTLNDDFLRSEPVFVLRLERRYQIRLSVKHRQRSQTARHRITAVYLRPTDSREQQLEVLNLEGETGDQEVLVPFDISSFDSRRLEEISPQFGEIEDKYVKLMISLELRTDGASTASRLEKDIYCQMQNKDALLVAAETRRRLLRHWRRAPQWTRDSAKGAVILAAFAQPMVSAAVYGDPSCAVSSTKCFSSCFFGALN